MNEVKPDTRSYDGVAPVQKPAALPPIDPRDQMPVEITQPAPESPPAAPQPKIIGRVMMGGRLVPVYERR